MKDFEPARIVEQIKPLKELMEARRKLLELKTKVDVAPPQLESHLQELLSDPDKLKKAAGDIAAAGNETKN
jgi:type VI secretion system protein ImpB